MNTDEPRSHLAALAGEVAERLSEMEEIQPGASADLCRRLATLWQLCPKMGYGLTLAALRGDTDELCRSFESWADQRGCKKQTVHYEWHADLRRIRTVFPELEAALFTLRDQLTHRAEASMPARQQAAHHARGE
jgi:hypothetical protein